MGFGISVVSVVSVRFLAEHALSAHIIHRRPSTSMQVSRFILQDFAGAVAASHSALRVKRLPLLLRTRQYTFVPTVHDLLDMLSPSRQC